MKFWERYGKLIGSFFGGVVLAFVAWGFLTDWNFTTDRIIASSTKPDTTTPKEGDSCTATNGKTGKVVNGDCVA